MKRYLGLSFKWNESLNQIAHPEVLCETELHGFQHETVGSKLNLGISLSLQLNFFMSLKVLLKCKNKKGENLS